MFVLLGYKVTGRILFILLVVSKIQADKQAQCNLMNCPLIIYQFQRKNSLNYRVQTNSSPQFASKQPNGRQLIIIRVPQKATLMAILYKSQLFQAAFKR